MQLRRLFSLGRLCKITGLRDFLLLNIEILHLWSNKPEGNIREAGNREEEEEKREGLREMK